MRKEDAIYAGEMSAHHYFRDNFYADNGMIPMLLLFQIMSESGKPLSALVSDLMSRYPVSGEINFKVKDPEEILDQIKGKFTRIAKNISLMDGLSMEFDNWRLSLRISNTEPVIRLNIEARDDVTMMQSRRDEVIKCIKDINDGL